MNQRWHLRWVALSILFFFECLWKTFLLHYAWVRFGSPVQITTSFHFQKCWSYSQSSSFVIGKTGNAGALSVWEMEIIWFKISAVCFSCHIISDGLCATSVSETSCEIVLQTFFITFQQLCFLNTFSQSLLLCFHNHYYSLKIALLYQTGAIKLNIIKVI